MDIRGIKRWNNSLYAISNGYNITRILLSGMYSPKFLVRRRAEIFHASLRNSKNWSGSQGISFLSRSVNDSCTDFLLSQASTFDSDVYFARITAQAYTTTPMIWNGLLPDQAKRRKADSSRQARPARTYRQLALECFLRIHFPGC